MLLLLFYVFVVVFLDCLLYVYDIVIFGYFIINLLILYLHCCYDDVYMGLHFLSFFYGMIILF